jgi:hypothetical protein
MAHATDVNVVCADHMRGGTEGGWVALARFHDATLGWRRGIRPQNRRRFRRRLLDVTSFPTGDFYDEGYPPLRQVRSASDFENMRPMGGRSRHLLPKFCGAAINATVFNEKRRQILGWHPM